MNQPTRTAPLWTTRDRTLASDGRPKVMGIVNVTPDSFSDGGRFFEINVAIDHAKRLIAAGADMLDIGGESSRPGAQPVALDEELRRVLPVIEALALSTDVPISIDTTKAEVARRALQAGAVIVNDITALEGDFAMFQVVVGSGAAVVLMHMRGTPQTMQIDPRYDDVVTEVHDYLRERIEWTTNQGIERERVAIDPGIGFGKTNTHSLELLRGLARFQDLGCAILIGTSRKGLLTKITGRPTSELATASAVSALAAIVAGASIVRVHDVAATVDAIRVWEAQRGWNAG